MIELPELDIRAMREVTKRIEADIASALREFAHGSWVKDNDVAATGAAALAIQRRIKGLEAALLHIAETDKALTGRAPKKENRAHG